MTNICIFGAGRIGQLHAGNVAANPRARLVSVVDVNAEAGQALAESHGARAETEVEAALDREDVDAVIIGAPTTLACRSHPCCRQTRQGGFLREAD